MTFEGRLLDARSPTKDFEDRPRGYDGKSV